MLYLRILKAQTANSCLVIRHLSFEILLMAGHSKYANIKHRKAAVDAKRGKVWTKLSKAITVAAKMGGGDPDANPRLRLAVSDAKAVSMPKDNIERAIKKGTGELESDNLEEVIYEGYGAGGVAVMCDALTDNRNRTAPELRKIFEVNGGSLGSTNCVGYMFDRKGVFLLAADKIGEEQIMELALEAGAEDIQRVEDMWEVTCPPEAYGDLAAALEDAEITTDSQELTRISQHSTAVEDIDTARRVLKLIEALDDHDDIQNVSSNFDIPDEMMAELETE